MRKIVTSIMSVMALVFSVNSNAQGISFDIDYMMLTTDLDVLSFDITALQLRASTPINENIDVEGAIAFGIGDDAYSFYPYKWSAELGNMLGIYAKLHTDPSLGYQFYGRVGLAKVTYDFTYSIAGVGSATESYDDTGLAYGFGVSFNANPTTAFLIEYSKLPNVNYPTLPSVGDLGDIESTALTIGVQMSL